MKCTCTGDCKNEIGADMAYTRLSDIGANPDIYTCAELANMQIGE